MAVKLEKIIEYWEQSNKRYWYTIKHSLLEASTKYYERIYLGIMANLKRVTVTVEIAEGVQQASKNVTIEQSTYSQNTSSTMHVEYVVSL